LTHDFPVKQPPAVATEAVVEDKVIAATNIIGMN
jgi:hypothetical protein